uniref:TIR domain-containing protein n=1 Tax=Mola mola TaxID=94237 RepID=A0A3Q3XN18_MOLML
YNLHEGEAFHFVPFDLDEDLSDDEVIWYKNNRQSELISTNESQSVHYHGSALFFLNLCTEDSGIYTAHDKVKLLHVSCKFLSYDIIPPLLPLFLLLQNFDLIKNRSDPFLWIHNSTKKDEAIYTCTCTWTHNHKEYKSSGSRRLKNKGSCPLPNTGSEIKLRCEVFCGSNVQPHCHASWRVNGVLVNREGYNQSSQMYGLNGKTTATKPNTISTAVLTIEKVSASDFNTEFKCIGQGFYLRVNRTLTLKRRGTILPLVIRGVCVLLFCVFAAALVKCFTIDLALLFRPCVSQINHSEDKRTYDAYVVYQMQRIDKTTEDALGRFITKTLPSVLEDKCGYRLFIHGRDDIPGEDHLEQVEDRMQQSKRLMVILTPGSGPEVTDQHPFSTYLQIGIHHALIQSEISVILIQIGDTGPEGYTYLPPGLQHLILKSAPIRWREDAWRNSRFWKRVRYLMPARPATKCSQSAAV